MEQIQLEDVCTRTKRVGRETAVTNMDRFLKVREFSWPCRKIFSELPAKSASLWPDYLWVGSGLSWGTCKSDFPG